MCERWRDAEAANTEFVIWDVGLGAGGNAIVALDALDQSGCKRVKMVSFDRTAGAAEFALQNSDKLTYVQGWEDALNQLLANHRTTTTLRNGCVVEWTLHLGDFPALIESMPPGSIPSAHAVMYDAFSPVRCPEMWTLSTLARVRAHIHDTRVPCMLTTSSRSTIVRVTLLAAGFYVGVGGTTGALCGSVCLSLCLFCHVDVCVTVLAAGFHVGA
jgi:tRNA U34 5-methylaminomethyl-2-thiouridine-forming methyltransferase MnmC